MIEGASFRAYEDQEMRLNKKDLDLLEKTLFQFRMCTIPGLI